MSEIRARLSYGITSKMSNSGENRGAADGRCRKRVGQTVRCRPRYRAAAGGVLEEGLCAGHAA